MTTSVCRRLGSLLALGLVAAGPGWAATCSEATGGIRVDWVPIAGTLPGALNCSGLLSCHPPVLGGVQYSLVPSGCNPRTQTCAVRATVPTQFFGIHQNSGFIGAGARLVWTNAASGFSASCGALGGEIFEDLGDAVIEIGGFTCGSPNPAAGTYQLAATPCSPVCNPPTATLGLDLTLPQLEALFCRRPPTESCPADPLAGSCCLGPGGGSSPAGGGPGFGGEGTGPRAQLYYRAGSVGDPDFPGAALWTSTLGRNWSHDYAERIVADPDHIHVWLITRFATFREFSNPGGDGFYQNRFPRDEYRRLQWLGAGNGWKLVDLDGTVDLFDAAGRWTRRTDRNGNAKVADYSSGPLTRVTMPDGRREDFFYHPSGKLQEIREIGMDGTSQRVWTYTWNGDNLIRISRPDSTALEFFYGDARFPHHLTRRDLVGTGGTRRVEAAWDFDGSGNVIKTWRGDPSSTGPNAVDLSTFSYTNPALPSQSVVIDPLGQATTFTIARDGNKPKITKIEGDCPTCGLGPNSQMTYGDTANPLLPTEVIDGRQIRTQMSYNANGRMISRTEAAGTALARTTTWAYGNSSFPAFPTRTDVPSTSGGAALRSTVQVYNAAGDLTAQTIEGAEAGSSFSLSTINTYNAAGQPLTIDPPGHGTADQTTMTYDPVRGNLLPLTRTDPLIGTTAFGHDAFNRQVSIIDPNGVETVTAYDELDRVLTVTQKGTVPADDLVTTYVYTSLRDLLRTILPRGNVIEYGYDPAGRLISIERKPDAATPGERTFYTLDAYGHRIKEELQRWTGSAWQTVSFTDFVFSSRCNLDKVIHPGGAVTEYAYDCNGNLEKVWDANHPRATNPSPTQLYAYDSLNRLSSLTQPWAGGGTAVTGYGYDVQDHLTQVTDAEGNTTNYTYSDRDLMTRQVSPVSGTTSHSYDEHGELVTEIDARGIVTTRTVDALDRVTAVTYPDASLNITYTYDDPAVPFSKGRLTRLSRPDALLDYRYDRFGRTLQDGDLSYTYDKNGNPATIVYPGGVTAVSTYDFADRPVTLKAQRPGQPDQPLVTASSYLPGGPLTSLTLGNGLIETHSFDARYFPTGISLSSHLSWAYDTDAVGNILSITDTLNPANNRTYDYQDHHYFLTRGDGPWGTRSWSYDRIGNRLTEIRSGVTDTYSYLPAPSGGRTPILSQIVLGTGGTKTYQYGPAGHLERTAMGADETLFTSDAAGRLARIERSSTNAASHFRYDGRSYLSRAEKGFVRFEDGFETGNVCAWTAGLGIFVPPICPPLGQTVVQPTYSSDGLLHGIVKEASPDRELIFHFAGRPVAQLELAGTTGTWKYLTVDHLGTPITATNGTGVLLWQGGFEPFGADWSGAGGVGVFLRFPGQWSDSIWDGIEALYYNLYRWYVPDVGRYSQAEPIKLLAPRLNYLYAFNSPLKLADPDGRAPKPPGGKWCGKEDGSIERPCPNCDLKKASSRLEEARRIRAVKCAGTYTREVISPRNTGIKADVDWEKGRAWIIPQGDQCVDYCLCMHERYHIMQASGMTPLPEPTNANSLECDAYGVEGKCLEGLMGWTIRVRVPLN